MAEAKYYHVTLEKRSQIQELSSSGFSQRYIAKRVGVHASTVCRELARNSNLSGYNFILADEKAQKRRSLASGIPKKMKGDLEKRVLKGLFFCWSPDQISGRLKLERNINISHEAIYQYVKRKKLQRQCLRHHGKKYKKRKSGESGVKCIPNRVDISERPAIVDEKSRIGDWEGDTVISHKSHCALTTLVDRHSKFVKITKIGRKTMKNTSDAVINSLKKLAKPVKTITFDNGSEFADHEQIAKKSGAEIYFARPFKSSDRGLNEHTNGLIREFLPKNFDFKDISNEKIQIIENFLNLRPRKVLDYKTPFEIFFDSVFTTGVALQT